MSPEFPPSSPPPLSQLRAKLARPRGAKQLAAILSQQDAQSAVHSLSITELHQLVQEVGFHDAEALIRLATPDQIRGCLDIDIWSRDRVNLEAAKPWLALVLEAGFEHLGQVWASLDTELAALILHRWTTIYDLTLGEDPEDGDERPFIHTPDTFFAIKFSPDNDTATLARRIIDDLYRADMVLARHTLMAAHSEPPAEMEEMSYRWKSGRMADIGYVDFYEALEVYRPINPASVQIGEETHETSPVESEEPAREPGPLPHLIAEQAVAHSFLARAIDRISDPQELTRLEGAIVILMNKVLSADRISPADMDHVRPSMEAAMATLGLGLEILSKQDVTAAAHALQSVSVTRLHRIGYSATLRLVRVAQALAPRAVDPGMRTTALLEALAQPRPLFPSDFDAPKQPNESQPLGRPFRSQKEIQMVAEELTKLAVRIAIADSLGVDLLALKKQPPPHAALDDYARTALSRLLVGGPFSPAPLTRKEIQAFRDGVLQGNTIPASYFATATNHLQQTLHSGQMAAGIPFASVIATEWLQELADLFANFPKNLETLDPRFVDKIILAIN